MISDEDKLKCLGRELALRRNAYPKWVASGRMKQAAADREIEVIEAIIEDYKVNPIPG
jgi:hypothetical protein